MNVRNSLSVALTAILLLLARRADAFCGFYVSGADAKLYADATQVVMMREGTRTVLAMQNDYAGPPQDFAMVVPVPVILQKENVKTLSREIFAKVDALSAPRLVEYWEKDPCDPHVGDLEMGPGGGLAGIGGGAGGYGSGAGRSTVKIEAQFEVGEYEILILSAQDSGGLDGWLRGRGYKIPENAEPALRPYVQAGSKFFVAKVNVAKVKLEGGRAQLSPLRFHYDSDTFTLPVRLGMLNSSGTQDLIVQILAPSGQRFEVANHPSVFIPTNLDVAESARTQFPAFYAALFDQALEKNPGAVVTEYAWTADSCDPCPGQIQGLTRDELATLGADVLPSAKIGPLDDEPRSAAMASQVTVGALVAKGALPPDAARVVAGLRARFRACYRTGLEADPSQSGTMTLAFDADAKGDVTNASVAKNSGLSPAVGACVAGVIKRASFGAGPLHAELPLTFGPATPSSDPAGPKPAARIGVQSIGTGFLLTRLHARYTRGALADDLVFKVADKVSGGREYRGSNKPLATTAMASDRNEFQARYAIRHGWPGALTCKEPVRGYWGGRWPDAGAGTQTPVAATKLAYAPRGGAALASFLPGGVPDLAALGAVAAPITPPTDPPLASAVDAGDAGVEGPKPRASRCGCDVIGGTGSGHALAATGLLVLAFAARRRRQRPPTTAARSGDLRRIDHALPHVRDVDHPEQPDRVLLQAARVPGDERLAVAAQRHAGIRRVAGAREIAEVLDRERTAGEVTGELEEGRALLARTLQVLAGDHEEA